MTNRWGAILLAAAISSAATLLPPPVASATPDEGDPQSSDCQATNSGLGGAETVCDTEGNAQITAVPPELGNGTGYGESACEGGCED